MNVNKVQIRRDGFVDRQVNIPVQLTWDYLGIDGAIDEYEQKIVE